MSIINFIYISFIVLFLNTSHSQTWLDTVRTIYSSPERLHNATFMKPVLAYGYGYGGKTYIAIVEDSSSASTIKVGGIDYQGTVIQPFNTIITRPFPIAKMQYVGIGEVIDNLQHQYLFWEEQDTSGWHIMFSHCKQTDAWETPNLFSPSPFIQQELVCTQTGVESYPQQLSFAVGWDENDSLIIVNLTPDSTLYRVRIPTYAHSDSIHPAISDGMIVWETHDSLSMLRYADLDETGSILSTDTIPNSQNASHSIFIRGIWQSEQYLCWMRTINGIGNIVTSGYDKYFFTSWSDLSIITEDNSGINIPIFAYTFPIITKSTKSNNFYFHYLVYTRIVNDSNAFVRLNDWGKKEFWTKNSITDVDAKPDEYVPSVWIEQTMSEFILRYHLGRGYPDVVEKNPSIPTLFSLEQNYPNPFNPSTIISYYIPSNYHVKLSILDILGRELKILVDEIRSIGFHEVKWDASAFPSGIYFYRLTSNGYSITKKMILIR